MAGPQKSSFGERIRRPDFLAAMLVSLSLATPLAGQSVSVTLGFDAEPARLTFPVGPLERNVRADSDAPVTFKLVGTRLTDKVGGNLLMYGDSETVVRGIYAGVDLRMRVDGRGNQALQLAVTPGFDPGVIAFQFDPATCLWLDGRELVIETPAGQRRLSSPVAFQSSFEGTSAIAVDFDLQAGGLVVLRIEDFDERLPLRLSIPVEGARLLIRD